MALPFPGFYDSKRVGELYLERAGLVADEARTYAARHKIKPSSHDKERIALFGIDCQVGFCMQDASLSVPGALADMRRAVEWIYLHLDRLTGLHFSMDTHRIFQIFHPAWWVDGNGNHPAPLTPITYDDVKGGKWMPIAHPRECLEYCKKLEQGGRYLLTIWPYHTLLGGVSHALVPAVMEAAIFHSIARVHQTHFETKGTHAMTENYSVLSPEVLELSGQVVGGFNAPFFKMLMEYDRIYIFGEAKSHCVLFTIRDIQGKIQATDPGLADKIYILEDAMSPVPAPPIQPLPPALNFPLVADQAMEGFRKAGMHIVKTGEGIR